MNKTTPPYINLPLVILLTTLALATSAQAVVVYSENFDGLSSLPSDFTVSNTTNATSSVSTTTGDSAPSLAFTDTTTSAFTSAAVKGNVWSSFDTSSGSNNIFQVDFDLHVAAYLGNGASTNRVSLSLASNSAAASVITIGFGHASISATDTNFLYALGGTYGAPPISTDAIGYTGSAFQSGFDFGTYNSIDGTQNSTGGFYHFNITYLDQASTATVTVTNKSNTSEVATFTINGITPTSVSNTNGRSIFGTTGQSGTGEFYVDNISIAAIPEPSSTMLLTFGIVFVALTTLKFRPASRK